MCYPVYTINKEKCKVIPNIIKKASKNISECWVEIYHREVNGEVVTYLVVAYAYTVVMIVVEKPKEDFIPEEYRNINFGIPIYALQDILVRTKDKYFTIQHIPDENRFVFQNGNIETSYEATPPKTIDYSSFFFETFSPKNPTFSLMSDVFCNIKPFMGGKEFPHLVFNPFKPKYYQDFAKPVTQFIITSVSEDGSILFGNTNAFEPLVSKHLFRSKNNINLYYKNHVDYLLNFYNTYKEEHLDFATFESMHKQYADETIKLLPDKSEIEAEIIDENHEVDIEEDSTGEYFDDFDSEDADDEYFDEIAESAYSAVFVEE